MEKSEAIGTLDSKYQEFRSRLDGVADGSWDEARLGEWNLNHVLAHMAGWFKEISGAMERVGRGERPVPEGVDYSDADAWNEKFAAKAQDNRTSALVEFDTAYAGYKAAAEALGEDKFGEQEGRPKIGNRLLQASGLAHFDEHSEHLGLWEA